MDRKYYLSVTEVLDKYFDKRFIPPDVLTLAQDKGTAVHSICLNKALGKFFIPPDHLKGYLKSFLKWFQNVSEVIAVEDEGYDDTWCFMGHLDILARMKSREIHLADLKTSKSVSRLWTPQLSAYHRLVEIKHNIKPDRTYAIMLKEDGGDPKQHDVDIHEGSGVFLNALAVHLYLVGR